MSEGERRKYRGNRNEKKNFLQSSYVVIGYGCVLLMDVL